MVNDQWGADTGEVVEVLSVAQTQAHATTAGVLSAKGIRVDPVVVVQGMSEVGEVLGVKDIGQVVAAQVDG